MCVCVCICVKYNAKVISRSMDKFFVVFKFLKNKVIYGELEFLKWSNGGNNSLDLIWCPLFVQLSKFTKRCWLFFFLKRGWGDRPNKFGKSRLKEWAMDSYFRLTYLAAPLCLVSYPFTLSTFISFHLGERWIWKE